MPFKSVPFFKKKWPTVDFPCMVFLLSCKSHQTKWPKRRCGKRESWTQKFVVTSRRALFCTFQMLVSSLFVLNRTKSEKKKPIFVSISRLFCVTSNTFFSCCVFCCHSTSLANIPFVLALGTINKMCARFDWRFINRWQDISDFVCS